YQRELDNILVLLIGGIPIAMTTVLSVTLAVGAQQFAKYKAIVTRITAIEELAGVTILCSDKTGNLTTNKLTIDKSTVKKYSDVSANDVCLLASYASQTENQDAIDSCIVGMVGTKAAQRGIKRIDFKLFDPVIKGTEITYIDVATGEMHRVTKGMMGKTMELCTYNKTEAIEQHSICNNNSQDEIVIRLPDCSHLCPVFKFCGS
ncbi:plasma membrane H+-transporting ATPase, partial [Phakopsora pachyrhizi]